MILVGTRNDSRCSSERFTELRRVDLEVRSILVGDAEPIAGEATVGHDVAEKLVERWCRLHVKSARSPPLMERRSVDTQGGCDLLQGSRAQRSSEGVGLEHVAQVVARDSGSNRQIPIRATSASIGLVKPLAPVCRQL